MSERDFSAGRTRAHEDEYFRRRDQELIEAMRRRSEAEQARCRMAEASGVFNDAILGELQAAGYGPETVTLLDLAPLIQVAWAEGELSKTQRHLIVDAALRRGVLARGLVSDQLSAWLDDRPPNEFFQVSLRALREKLDGLAPEAREDARRQLLEACSLVALASGRFPWLGRRVSAEERQVLYRIAAALEPRAPAVTAS